MAALQMVKPEELGKFVDEEDSNFTGFLCLQVVDQDGYPKKTKGSMLEAPLFLSKQNGVVVLEAEFPADPLFFLGVPEGDNAYLFGQWWLGPGGWARTNQIGTTIPALGTKISSDIEKDGGGKFPIQVEIPLLQGSDKKMVTATISTTQIRFVTKVTKAVLEIPDAHWKEMKEYRSKLWQSWKVWSGKDENEKKKKDDEKKDDDKKSS
eukprot:TRINITY_DN29272_c0_g1_i1.p1 TRINITY_DN29272_c0_g1~~TRINITY_DN29272_c0_g1_i1.p1  ORF type:complete len:208 (-),score=58.89 TRINITY_DN29272_c0_g1_i1:151-774(-)